MILIHGLGLGGYRSFGDQTQFIGPFSDVNLFIGQNNSGKSNILRYLSSHYVNAVKASKGRSNGLSFSNVDRNIGGDSGLHKVAFAVPWNDEILSRIRTKNNSKEPTKSTLDHLKKLGSTQMVRNTPGYIWFVFQGNWHDSVMALALSPDTWEQIDIPIEKNDRHSVWYELLDIYSGGSESQWIPDTMKHLSQLVFESPAIGQIAAVRQVRKASSDLPIDNSGTGLISRLAQLQHPEYENQHLKQDFDRINEFLKEVTGNDSAKIEIPHDQHALLVHMDGKTLPLDSLGTGIHEVTILAAAATLHRDQVICLEEPEVHLHPTLQRALIRYLRTNTTNQYFIATHSAHLLDTKDVSVFHVHYHSGKSVVEIVESDNKRAEICADLGYRASDLLQANCIIWVEGPSDRIYLNHWIKSESNELLEGLHYSIMFYGGRLLFHLSADDPGIDDFISLRKLNRNLAIVIDRDRDNPYANLNKTKYRVRNELNKPPGFAWITQGREIENYIDPDVLKRAIRVVHPRLAKLPQFAPFADCTHFTSRDGRPREIDKVRVAHEVTKAPANFKILDLESRIKQLVSFVRESNGIVISKT